MAQLNVRLPDALYQEVQSILKAELKTDVSEFVRDLFVDMILIYHHNHHDRAAEVLKAAGERQRIDTRPGTIMMLMRDWREKCLAGHAMDDFERREKAGLGPPPDDSEL